MTVSSMSWALEQECDTPLDKLILIYLADSFGMARTRRVSRMRLMMVCRCGPVALLEAIKSLDMGGYIRWSAFSALEYEIELMAPLDHKGDVS